MQASPAKVEAKTRPLYLNWLGWLAYVVMNERSVAAFAAVEHGKELSVKAMSVSRGDGAAKRTSYRTR